MSGEACRVAAYTGRTLLAGWTRPPNQSLTATESVATLSAAR